MLAEDGRILKNVQFVV